MITSFRIFESEYDEIRYSLYDDNSMIADNLSFQEAIEKAGQEYFSTKKIYVMLDDFSNFIDWITEWNEIHPDKLINQEEVLQYDEEELMETEELKKVAIEPITAFQALEYGDLEILYQWLKTNPNLDEMIGDELPICMAITYAKDDMTAYNAIMALNYNNADINKSDKTNKTALHYACYGLLIRTIELLIDFGMDIKTSGSMLPYLLVVGIAYSELSEYDRRQNLGNMNVIISMLLEEGASFNEKLESGKTIEEYYKDTGIEELLG